jgi:hypothetical protein
MSLVITTITKAVISTAASNASIREGFMWNLQFGLSLQLTKGVWPEASAALIVPDTESELFQLKLIGIAPVAVDPDPVPMVVQPAASAANSGRIHFAVEEFISCLLLITDSPTC